MQTATQHVEFGQFWLKKMRLKRRLKKRMDAFAKVEYSPLPHVVAKMTSEQFKEALEVATEIFNEQ